MSDPRLATKDHQHVWRRLGWVPWHKKATRGIRPRSLPNPPRVPAWGCPCGAVTHDPERRKVCRIC